MLATFGTVSSNVDSKETGAAPLTIICCDFAPDVVVRPEADGGTLLAAFVLVAAKSPAAIQTLLAETPRGSLLSPPSTTPQEDFLQSFQARLVEAGMPAPKLVYPVGFNGFETKYDITHSISDSPLVLEVRFLAEVVQIYGAFTPSVGAYFRLIRTRDQATLTSGIVATVNKSRGEPTFFTRPYLVPFIQKLGSHALGKEMTLVPAPASQLISTFSATSVSDVERMQIALKDMAERVGIEVSNQVLKQIDIAKSK